MNVLLWLRQLTLANHFAYYQFELLGLGASYQLQLIL
jgi:hypothetical protein